MFTRGRKKSHLLIETAVPFWGQTTYWYVRTHLEVQNSGGFCPQNRTDSGPERVKGFTYLFRTAVPVLGANYLKFDWSVPSTGLRF